MRQPMNESDRLRNVLVKEVVNQSDDIPAHVPFFFPFRGMSVFTGQYNNFSFWSQATASGHVIYITYASMPVRRLFFICLHNISQLAAGLDPALYRMAQEFSIAKS